MSRHVRTLRTGIFSNDPTSSSVSFPDSPPLVAAASSFVVFVLLHEILAFSVHGNGELPWLVEMEERPRLAIRLIIIIYSMDKSVAWELSHGSDRRMAVVCLGHRGHRSDCRMSVCRPGSLLRSPEKLFAPCLSCHSIIFSLYRNSLYLSKTHIQEQCL